MGASNWLECVAPIFLNRLADFCLVSDNFGGRWNSRPNGAREIQDTGKNSSEIPVFEDKDGSQTRSSWEYSVVSSEWNALLIYAATWLSLKDESLY